MTVASPILKWVGGKTKLLPELRARLPKKFGAYYEPFVGGAALFFSLCPGDAVLGDTNGALINVYRMVRSDVVGVIERLEDHKKQNARADYYYEVRAWWNEKWLHARTVDAAAAFLYLNKTCFNGLWRVNREGKYNVPRGDYTDPTIYDVELLREAARVLDKARLVIGPYEATTAEAKEGDLVYLDPPYDPVSKTSNFTAYTKDSFGKEHQQALAEYARGLRARGVQVMLSNNDTEYIRALYSDFCVDNVKCGRSINSKGSKRGKVDEVIITSYERTS